LARDTNYVGRTVSSELFIFYFIYLRAASVGARASLVVKVAGSRSDEVKFEIYLILAALGPCVYSASNRNEYWKH
jgi:hypothetical protein